MKRVLIVDDRDDNRYLLRALLEGHGFVVDEAVHGAEALTRARQAPPDLIVSDLLMPVMDGYTLLRKWKADEALGGVPFVVYTATYTDPRDERLALEMGADAFILKPAEPQAFMAKVAEIIDKAGDDGLAPPRVPAVEEKVVLQEYSAVLVRKLEAKQIELEQSNRELRESEARFRRLAENAADVVYRYELGPPGRFSYISPAVTGISGYTPAEHYANPGLARDMVHPEDLPLLSRLRGADAEFLSAPLTVRWICKDGSIVWTEQRNVPVYDAAGQLVAIEGIARDITERRALHDRLLQSQKMEAIGQLAGGVAHDFNNLLAAILLQVQLASSADGVPEPVLRDLDDIRAAAERAADLTRQLLLFGRGQVMQPRDLDLNSAVINLTRMLERVLGEDIEIRLDLHGAPLFVHGDGGMLDQVLLNLAVNARDAMPQGGVLTLRTREERPCGDLGVDWGAVLEVSDTGHGIPPEVRDRIFEPFFTTRDTGTNSGLGLATVFGIVEQHRGHVVVDSAVGEGTTIRVLLPATAGDARSPPEATHAERSTGTETLLLVEDDARLRRLTRMALARHGYQVIEAGDGAEALALWRATTTPIDLLLTDLVLPGGMRGTEVAAQLRVLDPSLRVIFTSGYSAEIAGRRLALEPGQTFLQKPARLEQLLAVVRAALEG